MSNGDKYNLSPSNMLVPMGQRDQAATNLTNRLAATFCQQQQQQQHQQQQQQNLHHNQPQQQHVQFDPDHNQRQEALMNLFMSLSNLASSNQQQHDQLQKAHRHQQPSSNSIDTHTSCPVNIVNNTSTNIIQLATTHTNHGDISSHITQPGSESSTKGAPSVTPDSLASSIQSVVAAAVMQQQLVRAALNSQPQPLQATISHPPQSLPPLLPPQQPPHITTPQSNHQSNSALQFYNEQQLRSGMNVVGTSQQAPFLQLEQNVQYPSVAIDDQQQHPQQQQRINYCTICNKELCNKYFMKTHMLKMHGINLEMEQSGENDETDCDDERSVSMDDENADGKQFRDSRSRKDKLNDEGRPSSAGVYNRTSSPERQRQSVSGDVELMKKNSTKHSNAMNRVESTVAQAATNKKSSTGSAPSNIAKQATSVMNGFAGNSMGGVVCDICNKELCSKYFLKVHKQNTHGIMTDYQDAGQFVYPFANALTGSSPFITAAAMSPISIGAAVSGTSLYPATPMFNANSRGHQKQPNNGVDFEQTRKLKKPRITKNQRSSMPNSRIKVESIHGGDNNTTAMTSANQSESLYRLMMTQQQGQCEPFSASGQPQIVRQSSQQPQLMPFDSMVANPMGALMCFGAMSPFGPAGISPTMIVEMILRNHHLFNRNNPQNQQRQQPMANKFSRDKNNNNDSKQKTPAKNSKDPTTSDSRYFTHYTEACPMCDRRFKSIKWLKTHIMNDHKQEIGTYMQMMMQQLYSTKNQQFAAPFDQVPCVSMNLNIGNQIPHQQQLQLQMQHNQMQQLQLPGLQQLQQQQQQQNLLSISPQRAPTNSIDHSLRAVQNHHQLQLQQQQPQPQPQQQPQHLNFVQDYLTQQSQEFQHGMLLDFSNASPNSNLNQDLSIDACCGREGLSPNNQTGLQVLDDRSPDDQLDLSAKFGEVEQSSDTDINDYAIQLNTTLGARSDDCNFLNTSSVKNNGVDDGADREKDHNCSTKSYFQDETDQSAKNNTSNTDNDLSLAQHIVKTRTTN